MWQGTHKVLFMYFIDVFHFVYDYVFVTAKLEKLTPHEHAQCVV